ncbi:hypothetical protein [Acidovorax sp.]|uniref:hypothetical protein n=1 Tax=Acidovorax sp. TaxID=1872122 RepID=UPI003BAE17C1
MEYLLILFLSGVVTAIVATNKGRSTFGWFCLGVALGPIGLVLSLVVSKNLSVIEGKAINSGEMKKCPFCAEIIKQEAVVCRFCGSDIKSTENNMIFDELIVRNFRENISKNTNLKDIQNLIQTHRGNPKMSIDDKKILLTRVGGNFSWMDAYGRCVADFMGESKEFPSGTEFGDWFRLTLLPTLTALNEAASIKERNEEG